MDAVFTNDSGNYLSACTLNGKLHKLCKQEGLPDLHIHSLRHTFAMLSLQSGDDVKTVSENLGHATVAFTLDVYGHVSETMKQASAARMEAFIQSIK